MNNLLPPNSTDLERKIAQAGQYAFNLPTIKIIKNIDQVPAQYLPFIAWQRSVDYWDENWQDALKRSVIKSARDQHRIKGTAEAIKRALQPFGYEVKIIEWFQVQPNLKPGTFNLELDLIGKGLTDDVYQEINRLIAESKAASRHLVNLTVTINPILAVRNLIAHQTAITYISMPRSS